MKWNLVMQELTVNVRSWWIGGIVILLFNAMFAGLADLYLQNDQMLEVINSMPKGLLEGFGMHPDSLSGFEGWMSGEPFTFYILLLGAYAAIWTGTSIAKERDQGTAEWLFTLPHSRGTIFLSKALAHFIQVTVVYVLVFVLVWLFGVLFSHVSSVGTVFLLVTAGYFISLAFAGIGYAVTVLLSSERAAMSVGIGIVLASFLFNMLAGMSDNLHGLSYVSLFKAFDTRTILHETTLTTSGIIVTLGIYVLGIAVGSLVLRRQDIQ